MELSGRSFIAGERGAARGKSFAARNAGSGAELGPAYFSSSAEDLNAAAEAAANAFASFGRSSAKDRAALLRAIAAGLENASAELVGRAMIETGLAEARLQGEVGRTCGQLRLFASVLDEGSWQSARIDAALPDREPAPRPDLRSMLFPVGPVAVFGASNFPLAFSVAGGDTAAALAAGNPVIVKAHPAHPGTSEFAAAVITDAVAQCGIDAGVFSMLYEQGGEDGFAIGRALVQHPAIQAVAFTGSRRGGRALMDLAAARERPIPCFTEMSSVNPVFVLEGALASDPEAKARGLHGSFTLGAGQFCTKPGLVFLQETAGASAFREELKALTSATGGFTMLTAGIADHYRSGLKARAALDIDRTAGSGEPPAAYAALFECDVSFFHASPILHEEIFGPSTLLVRWKERGEMLAAAEALEGHLTATVLGTEADLEDNEELIAILERKVGRLLFNGYPTGVEVSHAMVHGGPYPATSDSRFTSVGSQAILRFVRPRCYQNFPQQALPEALRDENPLGILRLVDGRHTRDPLHRR